MTNATWQIAVLLSLTLPPPNSAARNPVISRSDLRVVLCHGSQIRQETGNGRHIRSRAGPDFVAPIKMYGPPLGVKQKLEIGRSGLQKCIRPTGGANSWP